MRPIDFIDLKAQQQRILSDIEARMKAVLEHGRYIMGPEIEELEKRLADYVGTRHCIAVSSGTDALLVALMALGVGAGDEVITTPFTFIATAETVALLGARPVFADIDPDTLMLDPKHVELAITPRTRAIVPVSIYGACADFDAFNVISEKHNASRRTCGLRPIHVIEDGCQSFGATFNGRRSCGLSDIGCTSFFPSKPLGCYGDGGACFTNNDDLAAMMKQLRAHGQDRRYHHPVIGVNARMDTLQAAILLAKLEVFDEEVEARGRIGERYTAALLEVSGEAGRIRTPVVPAGSTSVFAQYTIRVPDRDKVCRLLEEQGIPTAVHYPVPLHLQPAFAGTGFPSGTYPVSEAAAESVLSLPMHPYLTGEDLIRIVTAVKEAVL